MEATELEAALLREFYALHGVSGFPNPQEIVVVARENTGNGRYVKVATSGRTALPDGFYDLGGKFIDMQGIPNGMMAVALVREGTLCEIELAVYGGDHWDGEERRWALR